MIYATTEEPAMAEWSSLGEDDDEPQGGMTDWVSSSCCPSHWSLLATKSPVFIPALPG